MLDDVALDAVAAVVDRIEKATLQGSLGLDDPREAWSRALSEWVVAATAEATA